MNQSLISILSSHNSARLCFKMAMPEQSSEQIEQNTSEQTVGINVEDWRVTSTRIVIDFYKGNPMLWDKTDKDNGNQHKTTKVLVADFEHCQHSMLLRQYLNTVQ